MSLGHERLVEDWKELKITDYVRYDPCSNCALPHYYLLIARARKLDCECFEVLPTSACTLARKPDGRDFLMEVAVKNRKVFKVDLGEDAFTGQAEGSLLQALTKSRGNA